ncbi:hypothetical protein GY45DRAFT_1326622 [Cubamyces sp. BRFM 1775]|nr:hypothetical protein GY45DRAFT_1326622 [Cubamyces sp. BRFM 1775]
MSPNHDEDSWVYVDDTDPRIVYSGGDWVGSESVNRGSSSKSGAWNGTLHGATTEGATAAIAFVGSEIGVVASVLTDQYGWPAVGISIDGIQQTITTFPLGNVSARTTHLSNATIFSSSVGPGDHVLTITNINGTSPNPFWLDCIFYKPLILSGNASTTSRPPSEKVSSVELDTDASSTRSLVTPERSYSSSLAVVSSGPTRYTEATDTRTSPAKNYTSAIVGGILGGIIGAVLLALLGYYCFKHRRKYWYHADEIVPADVGSRKRVSLFESSHPSIHQATDAFAHEPHPQYPAPAMTWPEKAEHGRGPCMPLPATAAGARTSPSLPLSRSKSFIETMRNRLLPPVSRHGASRGRTMEREVDAGYLIPSMVDGMTSAGRLPPPYTG